MDRRVRPTFFGNERGQAFAGYIIAVLVLVSLATYVMQKALWTRRSSQNEYFRAQALSVAKAGFEDTMAYFRAQPGGVYLLKLPVDCPSGQNDPSNPWKLWPDAAFMPDSNATDEYANLVTGTIGSTGSVYPSARGIVRTIPLADYSNTQAATMQASRLWGRSVVKRQNARNWSPNADSYTAFTDPEAVHDITSTRGQAPLGSGNYWSIYAKGYVYASDSPLVSPTAFTNGDPLQAPLAYKGGAKVLLASASVYGEVYRLNFNIPLAPVFVYNGNYITLNAKGIINAGTAAKYAYGVATSQFSAANTSAGSTLTGSSPIAAQISPSVGTVFPGLDATSLQNKADVLGADASMFPLVGSPTFTQDISTNRLYFCTGSAHFVDTNTDGHVLSGVGLVFINGDLTIDAKSDSNFSGVVYVTGKTNIRGPGTINGTLICQGTVTLGLSGDSDAGSVTYSQSAVTAAQTFLQNFQVQTQSVVDNGY